MSSALDTCSRQSPCPSPLPVAQPRGQPLVRVARLQVPGVEVHRRPRPHRELDRPGLDPRVVDAQHAHRARLAGAVDDAGEARPVRARGRGEQCDEEGGFGRGRVAGTPAAPPTVIASASRANRPRAPRARVRRAPEFASALAASVGDVSAVAPERSAAAPAAPASQASGDRIRAPVHSAAGSRGSARQRGIEDALRDARSCGQGDGIPRVRPAVDDARDLIRGGPTRTEPEDTVTGETSSPEPQREPSDGRGPPVRW